MITDNLPASNLLWHKPGA